MSSLGVLDRVVAGWNAFVANNPMKSYGNYGPTSGSQRPDRPYSRMSFSDKSIKQAIYTRIAVDLSAIEFKHIELDDQGRYLKEVDSRLNEALTFEPNLDQAPRSWRQDLVTTLFDSGMAAIVPVDTTRNPHTEETVDIITLRVGNILEFFPSHVRVSLYNEATGKREELTLEKRFVAVVYNPFYDVMNEPSGTLQRLTHKLSLLDSLDEITASGKLDILIKLPYVVKSEARREQANARRLELETQLKSSTYGIGYVDGTEDVVQLNRPAENNLLTQVEYLVKELYAHLGITQEVMNGTADEATMLNYYNRTIEPLADAIAEAMRRRFTRKQPKKETIRYFRDPFKFVPLSALADVLEKLSRNKIITGNEARDKIGMAPIDDESADKLDNSNMPVDKQAGAITDSSQPQPINQEGQNGSQDRAQA